MRDLEKLIMWACIATFVSVGTCASSFSNAFKKSRQEQAMLIRANDYTSVVLNSSTRPYCNAFDDGDDIIECIANIGGEHVKFMCDPVSCFEQVPQDAQ